MARPSSRTSAPSAELAGPPHCDDAGGLVAGAYGTVRRDLCPQQTATDGEDFAAWMLAKGAVPA
eukprot:7760974-Pyramimonas_sp.AAC.1